MNALSSLWLPILLSAVVVFIISSLIHMVIKWHAGDYSILPNEDAVRAAIRAGNPAPGRYVTPHCGDMKDMASEAMQQKYREGPVGHFTIGPNGVPKLGKFLGQWFLWSLIVAAVAGYLAARVYGLDHAHARGAAKLVGAVTFIAHGFGTVQESIWAMRPWAGSAKSARRRALRPRLRPRVPLALALSRDPQRGQGPSAVTLASVGATLRAGMRTETRNRFFRRSRFRPAGIT